MPAVTAFAPSGSPTPTVPAVADWTNALLGPNGVTYPVKNAPLGKDATAGNCYTSGGCAVCVDVDAEWHRVLVKY